MVNGKSTTAINSRQFTIYDSPVYQASLHAAKQSRVCPQRSELGAQASRLPLSPKLWIAVAVRFAPLRGEMSIATCSDNSIALRQERNKLFVGCAPDGARGGAARDL